MWECETSHRFREQPFHDWQLPCLVPDHDLVRMSGAGSTHFLSNRRFLAHTLYTIGYERHSTPASLIAVLESAGVRRLVDVRELPQSRRRGFSKTALAAALGDAHITYEHVRQLGNPKAYRDLYKSGRVNEGEQRYRAHLHNGSYPALVELSATIANEPTCILCFEASHEICHRAVIVEALEGRLPDLEVMHLY